LFGRKNFPGQHCRSRGREHFLGGYSGFIDLAALDEETVGEATFPNLPGDLLSGRKAH
jgi:hypothetical protein